MSQNKPKSKIWNYFTIDKVDITMANCNICNDKLFRGGKDPRSFGAKVFIKHLEAKHRLEFIINKHNTYIQ